MFFPTELRGHVNRTFINLSVTYGPPNLRDGSHWLKRWGTDCNGSTHLIWGRECSADYIGEYGMRKNLGVKEIRQVALPKMAKDLTQEEQVDLALSAFPHLDRKTVEWAVANAA